MHIQGSFLEHSRTFSFPNMHTKISWSCTYIFFNLHINFLDYAQKCHRTWTKFPSTCTKIYLVMHKNSPDHAQKCTWSRTKIYLGMHKNLPKYLHKFTWSCTDNLQEHAYKCPWTFLTQEHSWAQLPLIR